MNYVGIFSLATIISAILCALLKKYAASFGYVAVPKEDRWHRKVIPLGGGMAIFFSFVITLLITLGIRPFVQFPSGVLILIASAIFFLGFLDDRKGFRPTTKLLLQILLASAFISFGFELRLTSWAIANVFLTLFWIVGITNAFNLLDNMDGMAAGIAFIALFFRLLIFLAEGSQQGSIICLIMMGALLGFLFFNFQPASIFMGDAGSMFIGFFISTLVMTGVYPYTKALVSVLLLPVLILLIPIFDTALVTISRTLSGRRISQGGRDHVSHRLVALGLSERKAVLLMYGMSAVAGTVAFILYQIGFSYAVMGVCILTLGFVCLGIYLHGVKVYPQEASSSNGLSDRVMMITNFRYKRQVGAMLGDVILIAVAYYSAFLLRFPGISNYSLWQYSRTLPLVIAIQLLCNYLFGCYRTIWQYASMRDLIAILKAIGAATLISLLSAAYVYKFRSTDLPVFAIYGMSLFLLTGGFRISFRLLDDFLNEESLSSKKILIYGAGDQGELLAREIMRNRTLNMSPLGFIDDDPNKQKLKIHGVPVVGDLQSLQKLLSTNDISEIVISTEKINPQSFKTLATIADEFGVPVRRLKITLQ
jgi:UDP-GlcNAc:undecaprenyl-phosphate/decaprenyl-phosphate GlcNAc-1-phosphate transferase